MQANADLGAPPSRRLCVEKTGKANPPYFARKLRLPAVGRRDAQCRIGPEKESIFQKTGLMFSIVYGRKNAGFSIFSHDHTLCFHDIPGSAGVSPADCLITQFPLEILVICPQWNSFNPRAAETAAFPGQKACGIRRDAGAPGTSVG